MQGNKMLTLYNTLSRKKEVFTPLDPDHVRMYQCGPTVYDFAHIGNARPAVVFDVLARLLRRIYPKVTFARNITDIDDKIIKAACEKNETIKSLTERTTLQYQQDMASIGSLDPDYQPRATDHVVEMITIIETLIQKGHAYVAENHVLFRVNTFKAYGQLSRCKHDEMLAGARVDVAPYKKDPEDFVLWKPSERDAQMPGWESPWGYGRPGWHIECSAMAGKYLGTTFDIHVGGQDLIFPHHENEIAQSQACYGPETFAKFWLHNGMLTVTGSKMSKSLGNILTVHDLLKSLPGEVIRYVLLSTHYRQPLEWNDHVVEQAYQSLDRLYTALRCVEPILGNNEFDVNVDLALKDDLNTPLAIAGLHEIATHLNKETDKSQKQILASKLKASGLLLGLLQQDAEIWFKRTLKQGLRDEEIQKFITEREQARIDKNYQLADDIRETLSQAGILLEDCTGGTKWKRCH